MLNCNFTTSELGVREHFELIEYNPNTATQEKKAAYKANVNVHGTVPSLVTPEGQVLTEATAICVYIANIYKRLMPDHKERPNYYT